MKWISVKIVVDDRRGELCAPACPHFDQHAGVDNLEERCGVYHRMLVGRRRCDECRRAKEL